MKKLRGLKYGVLLGVCLLIVGASKGCQRMVNMYNDLAWSGGTSLTARLACSSNTFEADSGEYSNCQKVSGSLCNCSLSLDGEDYGSFSGCLDVSEYCSGDATLILSLDESDNIGLYIQCVERCGDSIMDAGYPVQDAIILDTGYVLENIDGMLELYREE